MKQHLRRTCGGAFLVIAVVLLQAVLFAEDSLTSARDLYASASYEDALAMVLGTPQRSIANCLRLITDARIGRDAPPSSSTRRRCSIPS